ncbi:MAG: hypothetical protein Q4C91_10530 [Eubacteriales bacterium]|nr:hypothetical protein [Eubacteriales bacterium]
MSIIEYEGYFSQMVPLLQQPVRVPVILTGDYREFQQTKLLLMSKVWITSECPAR